MKRYPAHSHEAEDGGTFRCVPHEVRSVLVA